MEHQDIKPYKVSWTFKISLALAAWTWIQLGENLAELAEKYWCW